MHSSDFSLRLGKRCFYLPKTVRDKRLVSPHQPIQNTVKWRKFTVKLLSLGKRVINRTVIKRSQFRPDIVSGIPYSTIAKVDDANFSSVGVKKDVFRNEIAMKKNRLKLKVARMAYKSFDKLSNCLANRLAQKGHNVLHNAIRKSA